MRNLIIGLLKAQFICNASKDVKSFYQIMSLFKDTAATALMAKQCGYNKFKNASVLVGLSVTFKWFWICLCGIHAHHTPHPYVNIFRLLLFLLFRVSLSARQMWCNIHKFQSGGFSFVPVVLKQPYL